MSSARMCTCSFCDEHGKFGLDAKLLKEMFNEAFHKQLDKGVFKSSYSIRLGKDSVTSVKNVMLGYKRKAAEMAFA